MTTPPISNAHSRPGADLHAATIGRSAPPLAIPPAPRPGRSDAAMLGLMLDGPFLGVAGVALLLADRPVPESLPIGLGLQVVFVGLLFLAGLTRPQSEQLAAPATATGPVHAPVEATDIWQISAGPGPAGNAGRIALIAPNTPKSRRIKTRLAGPGREIHHCSDGDAMYETVQVRPEDWGLVILDRDAAPGGDAALHDLADFRAVCPQVPVVLLTGATLHTDLSPDHPTPGAAKPENPVPSRQLADDLKAAGLHFSAGH